MVCGLPMLFERGEHGSTAQFLALFLELALCFDECEMVGYPPPRMRSSYPCVWGLRSGAHRSLCCAGIHQHKPQSFFGLNKSSRT
jgi:hypothetical protein